jgi:hypothetical protein
MHWHKWSLWDQYEEEKVFVPRRNDGSAQMEATMRIVKIRQKRHCLTCNKMQDEIVRDNE